MNKVEILGVEIDDLSLQEILGKAKFFLSSQNQHYIVTPNPEFIVAAQQDREFKEILNYADIAVADGIGLVKAAKFLKQRLQRVTGVDLMWNVAELAEQNNCSVYLLGGVESIAAKTAEILQQHFKNLQIAGAESGGVIDDPKKIDYQLIERIKISKAKILFVAFGQIKQEKWIFYHLDKLPNIKLAIGVGGAFDYITGVVKRPPAWIRSIGLEWLYRLIQQPRRYRRIINAVIVFPFLIIKKRFIR